jgi:hypothetical protein
VLPRSAPVRCDDSHTRQYTRITLCEGIPHIPPVPLCDHNTQIFQISYVFTLEDRTTGQTSEMVSDRILLQSNHLMACALEGWYVDDNTDVPGDTRFYRMSYKAYGVPIMNVHLDSWYSSFAPQEIIDQCFVEPNLLIH